jgi:hypothetical protein
MHQPGAAKSRMHVNPVRAEPSPGPFGRQVVEKGRETSYRSQKVDVEIFERKFDGELLFDTVQELDQRQRVQQPGINEVLVDIVRLDREQVLDQSLGPLDPFFHGGIQIRGRSPTSTETRACLTPASATNSSRSARRSILPFAFFGNDVIVCQREGSM